MDDYTADDVQEALKPLASLLGKSEKAHQKVASGLWQYRMLGENIKALRLALALLEGESAEPSLATRGELEDALATLDSTIVRVAATEAMFAVGTSQHSLQRNRLKALRVARSAVMTALDAC